MRGSKTLYALGVLVIVAAAWAYFTPIDISVRARGIVRPEGDPIRIVSEGGGRIRKVHAGEGSTVRMGDPLLQLDDRDLVLKQRALESRIHFIELRLAEAQRQLGDAADIEEQSALVDDGEFQAAQLKSHASLESARLRFSRSDMLLQEGLIPRQAYEEARLALAQAEAEESRLALNQNELKRAQAEARLRDLIAQTTPLRAELATLYHDLDQVRLTLDRLTITSPADGRITSLASLHAGEFLAAATTIAAITPTSRPLVIESLLPASDRTYVEAGQRVRLETETELFDGSVLSISPDARFNESLNGAYRVLVTPGLYTPNLQLGMTFQVHFITRQERLLALLFRRTKVAQTADKQFANSAENPDFPNPNP